jgi:dCMP deaminase
VDKRILLMRTAEIWSQASCAQRSRVGCVIAKDQRILSTGYNGTLPGKANVCEQDGTTMDSVVHAEQNALMFCAKNGIPTRGCDFYVTLSPCIHCAKLMITAGASAVHFRDFYRDIKPVQLLLDNGLEVYHHSTTGIIQL